MTVVELLQCIGWGVLGYAPLWFSFVSGEEDKKDGVSWRLAFSIAMVLQLAALVFAFKAGGR